MRIVVAAAAALLKPNGDPHQLWRLLLHIVAVGDIAAVGPLLQPKGIHFDDVGLL